MDPRPISSIDVAVIVGYDTCVWPVSIGGTTFTFWQEYALYFSLPASLVGFIAGTLLGTLPAAPETMARVWRATRAVLQRRGNEDDE
ncbi:MAG TPA: hypothetical protein QGG47_14300 [Acidobacteriota bacterium]|nr:hypothetical protein [Acidobacteriota bacterium]